jgi:hypothetical protein
MNVIKVLQNEQLIESDVICSNLDDSSDCDLYFWAQLLEFSFTPFKLVYSDDQTLNLEHNY